MFFSYTILEMCIDATGSDLLIALVDVIYEQFVHKPAIVFMILHDLNVVALTVPFKYFFLARYYPMRVLTVVIQRRGDWYGQQQL
jgi:hypothetical protein